MIKKNTAKLKQEIAEITVTDKKNKADYIIVGVDLSKTKLDVKHIKYNIYSNDEKGHARFIKARERAEFRNGIVKIAATKVSAGVSTGIGDHESKYTGKGTDEIRGDEQFEIDDNRSFEKMYQDIAKEGLQPVLNDYLYV